MGRSPFFTVESIQRPPIDQTPENLILLESLQSLKKGQKIKIYYGVVPTHYGIPRSISTYEYTPSAVSSNIVYEVTTTDWAPYLSTINLTAIALRDQRIPDTVHITGWIITSDGYIRETEHYTILHKLNGLEIVE
jgi:hypothetical protein